MPDEPLTPDEIAERLGETEAEPRRQLARIANWLGPVAAAALLVPCDACGALVVIGRAARGTRLALDLHLTTYTIPWPSEAEPVRYESRGYAVHQCLLTKGGGDV